LNQKKQSGRKSKTQELREESAPYHANGISRITNSVSLIFSAASVVSVSRFERAGGQCVFSSDWNKYAQLTYAANFGETPHGDIIPWRWPIFRRTTFFAPGFPAAVQHCGRLQEVEPRQGSWL